MATRKEPKFEDALARLETIVGEMEGGQLNLDELMKKFEEGMKLARFCSEKLGETERRIEILVKKADDAMAWEPLDAAADGDGDGDRDGDGDGDDAPAEGVTPRPRC